MELKNDTRSNVNISAETEILSYTYSGSSPIEVIVRADIGTTTQPIAGGGNYSIHVYIDGVLVTPTSINQVPSGKNKTIAISRPVPLNSNDVLTVSVIGQGGDTSVGTITTVRSATPLLPSDLFGTGAIPIDHDYPDLDSLTYLSPGGTGINGATIVSYRRDDYDNGNRADLFVTGRAVTVETGEWRNPIYLNPGAYTLVFAKSGFFGPDVVNITVS